MPSPPLPTHATWEGDLDQVYDSAVAEWLGMEPGLEAAAFYRQRVFPLTCERFRRDRDGVEPLDLLYIPVGTQPYAPTLAALANPAACVALLETSASAPYGQEVEAALAAGSPETVFLHVRVHETAVADIALAIRDIFDTRALPSGSKVGADTTGGTKVMTAAMAGVGNLYGWRLFYISSTFERKFGFSHHEHLVLLDNVLDVFGARRREEALALLSAGACAAAEEAFLALVAESAASAGDRGWASLAAASGALRRGEPGGMRRHLRQAAATLQTRIPRSVGEMVLRSSQSTRSVLQARIGDLDSAALAWLAAKVCWNQADPPAARALAEAAAKALGLGAPETTEKTPALIRRLAGTEAIRQRRALLGWLDHYLGEGLAEQVEVLR